jgi:hypothetical protein
MEATKNEPALLEQDEARGKDHTESIPETKPLVNPDAKGFLADMRRDLGLMAKDVAAMIRTKHKGFDAALYSKIERPDDYGIELVPDTASAVAKYFNYKRPQKAHRVDKRTDPRVQGRLPATIYARLQAAQIAKGIHTNQAWVEHAAKRDIEEYERSIRP